MTVKAQRVTILRDNKSFCRPSDGYDTEIEIDIDQYMEVATVQGELPECDLAWPKGAPILNMSR